ncbi:MULTISPECIES: tRNA (adenosine(37)-N6)-threonylcarbamoyltransferase complex ATPase subunit type 1 TsaE [Arthrobacter]|uniref:tRNA threonylcarbamoyladenosine biosynthesis protein TsaE n=1 Tax=Arthrobacter alpinus TaxID=656366 RepID=A0A0S2LXL5_9MICC|nr:MULTISPECIES: tRNA (adenosine(37)-N6)-threonylcarbamoyltransferase complex ATPase subunit type 1 TsaE [Arthrobacter]ALO66056.1 tRNA threonylcarbamoyladenosine biosynthesis protein TsaE [Arthrobacter alpinus]
MAWEFSTSTAAQTQQLAENLARLLQAGDLIILSGELGAGKTTFTQGLGRSLGVREGIISPTFVLVRIHPNLPDGPNPGGPDLVHVDAYRLGSPGEIDDIDLENTMDSSVTVVEWGAERVEHLAASRLEIELVRAVGGDTPAAGTPAAGTGGTGASDVEGTDALEGTFDFTDEDDDEPRTLRLHAVGPRWEGTDFSALGQLVNTTE